MPGRRHLPIYAVITPVIFSAYLSTSFASPPTANDAYYNAETDVQIQRIAAREQRESIQSTNQNNRPQNLGSGPRGATGACCWGTGCALLPQSACETEGLRWLGDATTCDQCPSLPTCPIGTLYGQRPGSPFSYQGAGTSELFPSFQRYENFGAVGGSITSLTWYGFDLEPLPNGGFIECEEFDNTFTISFHPNLSERPGSAVCEYTVIATRTPTGLLYDNFELNQYEATLPDPCTITNGFVSIVGQGSTSCWFVWSTPPGSVGDGFSVCTGCTNTVQPFDHAVCLQGTLGGVFGACCDESTSSCQDNIEIDGCRGSNQRFVPDATCDTLDPPCGVITGACCDETINRGIGCIDGVRQEDCAPPLRYVEGQACQFINPQCGEATGACCQGGSICIILTQAECESERLNWLGPDTTCDLCPPLPTCPEDTIFGQQVADPIQEPTAFTSEASRGIEIFENFYGMPGPITGLRFFGLDLQPFGNGFVECVEFDPTFSITFYADEGNAPGTVLCQHTLLATRTPSGIFYLNAEMNVYDIVLPEPCIASRGWVSIVGLGDGNCYFLWLESREGDNRSIRFVPEFGMPLIEAADYGLCLTGMVGGVSGACCNDLTGQCTSNVSMENCTASFQRFEPGVSCNNLSSPCGQPRGACCFSNNTCLFVDDAGCSELGGSWLGADMPCLICPCQTPCPVNGIPEGEVDCSNDYVDDFNAGCDMTEPAYINITKGQTICGTTGNYDLNGQNTQDADWYEFENPTFGLLSALVVSESNINLTILDGTFGCPGAPVAEISDISCEPVQLQQLLPGGTYWIVVRPASVGEIFSCGSPYTLMVGGLAECAGDIDFDFDIDMADFATMQNDFGLMGQGQFFDLNGDGVIDINDVNIMTPLFGATCPIP